MSVRQPGLSGWWELPGPHQLVEAVADDLDQGKCVVVQLPQHLPAGFYEAVTRHLQWLSSRHPRWQRLPGSDVGEATEDEVLGWLYERLGLQATDYVADKSALHLCEQEAFRGLRFLLNRPDTVAAGSWSRFLAEYQHALKDQPHVERSVFLLILDGEATAAAPSPNINLAVHAYGEHVSTDDIRLLLRFAQLRTASAEPALKCALRQSMVAALATTDPALALQLARGPFTTLLQPADFLAAYASSLSWQVGPAPLPLPEPPPVRCRELWASGGWASNASRPCVHSALLALHGRHDLLTSRIWEGQLTVLLPFLERKRQVLLHRYRADLACLLPYKKLLGKNFVEVHELAELELGDLCFLRTQPELKRHGAQLSQDLQLLRRCRVKLSHQQPVDEATIDELIALA